MMNSEESWEAHVRATAMPGRMSALDLTAATAAMYSGFSSFEDAQGRVCAFAWRSMPLNAAVELQTCQQLSRYHQILTILGQLLPTRVFFFPQTSCGGLSLSTSSDKCALFATRTEFKTLSRLGDNFV